MPPKRRLIFPSSSSSSSSSSGESLPIPPLAHQEDDSNKTGGSCRDENDISPGPLLHDLDKSSPSGDSFTPKKKAMWPPPKMAPAAAAVAANKKEAAAPAAAAAAEVAEPKGQQAAGAPPGAAQQVPLEEKSARYWFLWQELQALEADLKHSGMLDAAFLKMDDAKAAELDNKIKQQRVAEGKVFNEWWGVKNDVTKALCDCIK